MSQVKKLIISVLLCITVLSLSISDHQVKALSSIPFIVLSKYKAEVDIGEQLYVAAITSTGKQATWKSSNSSIASVNTYGIVTPKKAGMALITAKVKGAEASCVVNVRKTLLALNMQTASIERGENVKLTATASNGSKAVWKSSKKSIAVIDEYGKVTALKPGETVITATADGSSVTCFVTVKQPAVSLDTDSISLYRGGTAKLTASVSSGISPAWKTNRKSVATVNANGVVTAVKNGTAIITATVDGVSTSCQVTVQKPEITLNKTELSLKKGDKASITAAVSSKNKVTWSTSNPNVAIVNLNGEITAIKKGKAYIYATEDGTKMRCTVIVTE